MPSGSRATAGLNTTDMQQKHRWTGPKRKPITLEESARRWVRTFLIDGIAKSKEEVEKAFEEAGFKAYLLHKLQAELIEGVDVDGVWSWKLKPEVEEPVLFTVHEAVKEPGEDEYSLTADERKTFGIKDTEQHCWIRDPEVWRQRAPGDSGRKFLRDNPAGRIIYHNGQTVTNGDDLILAALPKAIVEARREVERQRDLELQRQIESEKMLDDEFDPTDRAANQRRKQFNTQQHISSGMIGPQSPSSGMPYEEYVRNRGLTAEDIEREERSYSLRGYTDRELDGDEAARVIAEQRSQRASQQPRGEGGKFYSLPPSVRPRNLARTGAEA